MAITAPLARVTPILTRPVVRRSQKSVDRANAGTVRRRQCCFRMDTLADYSSLLLAIDFLLAMILFDVEMNDPRIKLERVEARREAIRRLDSER